MTIPRVVPILNVSSMPASLDFCASASWRMRKVYVRDPDRKALWFGSSMPEAR